MAKYKVKVSIEENNPFWMVVEDGELIKNPTEEDLIEANIASYNNTNICDICREENKITDKSILYPGNTRRDTNKNGKRMDEWVCLRHGESHYNRYNPSSHMNIIKSMRDRRNRNLRYHNQIIGDKCEELTEKWTWAKRLSVEYDKYSQLPLDHGSIAKHVSIMIGDRLVDLYGKTPQTKGHCYNRTYDRWSVDTRREHNKKFDVLIFYCISDDGKTIERIYIFPKEQMIKKGITISKNPSRGIQWYEEYRVTDDNELKKIDGIWKKIISKKKI